MHDSNKRENKYVTDITPTAFKPITLMTALELIVDSSNHLTLEESIHHAALLEPCPMLASSYRLL